MTIPFDYGETRPFRRSGEISGTIRKSKAFSLKFQCN